MSAICSVCPHYCNLKEGQIGFCRARKNEGVEIKPVNYGIITSIALDPIEKKPLYHFYPGKKILSVGSYGCNLRCPFCQNYEISMSGAEKFEPYEYFSPQELVKQAIKYTAHGNIGIAYTYNEPIIGYEYVLDCAKLAKEKGLKNVVVTNGYATLDTINELLPYIDAMNIDLKAFTQQFYSKIKGELKYVMQVIETAAKKCHVELTTLIIPGENDSFEENTKSAKWIASVNEEIPLHLSRFFPKYQLSDINATDVGHIYALAENSRKYLKHVYTGNC